MSGAWPDRKTAARQIVEAGRFLDGHGLAPATSGNYSVRLSGDRFAVTVSGRHKGRLTDDDVMTVDAAGAPLEEKKPSAETLLHAQIYRLVPDAGAILHVHSIPGVVLTRDRRIGEIVLAGYEMLKVFPGIDTHETAIHLPVVDNDQDMGALAAVLEPRLAGPDTPRGYLIRDHGYYVWAPSMARAEVIVEGLEHLLACEVEIRRQPRAALDPPGAPAKSIDAKGLRTPL